MKLMKDPVAWYESVRTKYAEDIQRSVDGTVLNHPEPVASRHDDSKLSLFKTDTVSSLFAGMRRNPNSRYCILNFASYLNPGGGFIKGAHAQEEMLCYESTLYPVLSSFQKDWYDPHLCHWDEAYSDDCIVSPHVTFIRGSNQVHADVFTCAAVNHNKLKQIPTQAAHDIMRDRMEFVYQNMNAFGADRIILGAWGCGVFGNDPTTIARYWKEIYESDPTRYAEVIHAVPDTATYYAFRKVMM